MDSVLEFLGNIPWWLWIIIFLALVAIRDIFFQRKHTISHNFPIVGHLRYLLESIGPEMRQYFVANNREELPFNRIERGWIYASAKQENNYEGFGTDRDIYAHQHIFINNAMMPYKVEKNHPSALDKTFAPCAKVMGAYNKRKRPYRPASIINVSAMSFGSLSAKAIESLNKGVKLADAYHNTGEGGLSPYHSNGGDVIFHFGTGYFGVRAEDGGFSMEKMVKLVEDNPFIRAIEVKLSQGAKPGKGGVLPGKKITQEIAEIRGVEVGKTVLSPPNHKAFSTVPELVDFVENIAEATGLPVGIKAAIGKLDQWEELDQSRSITFSSNKKQPEQHDNNGEKEGPPSRLAKNKAPKKYKTAREVLSMPNVELCHVEAAMQRAEGPDENSSQSEEMPSVTATEGDTPKHVKDTLQALVKYSKYLDRQEAEIQHWKRNMDIDIPTSIRYEAEFFPCLSSEELEKLRLTRPSNFRVAAEIPGLTPHSLIYLYQAVRKGKAVY